jgi:hypothetical protein
MLVTHLTHASLGLRLRLAQEHGRCDQNIAAIPSQAKASKTLSSKAGRSFGTFNLGQKWVLGSSLGLWVLGSSLGLLVLGKRWVFLWLRLSGKALLA